MIVDADMASSMRSIGSLITAVAAVSLAFWTLTRTRLPGCGPRSGCSEMLAGRWSRVGRLPVAALGAIVYLALLGIASWRAFTIGAVPLAAQHVLSMGALLVVGAALWFTALQAVVIRRWCLYCTLTHAAGATAAGLILFQSRVDPAAVPPGLIHVLVAGLGMLLLILGQIFIEPRLYALERTSDSPKPVHSAPQATPQTGDPKLADPNADVGTSSRIVARHVPLMDGKVTLAVGDWALLGDPQAPHVIAVLFDYTCPDCRAMHGLLTQARARYGPELAVLLLPVPMEPTCNPHMEKQHYTHAQACRLARLGLLVWAAGPARYEAFDQWMFAQPEPPPLGLAVGEAQRLMGDARAAADLDPHRPDPQADARIAQAIAIYRSIGKDRIPMFLLPHGLLTGHLPSADKLLSILQGEFARPR